jgi:Tol biopolymer transport system component
VANGGGGIWLVDLERGAKTRVASGNLPIWSADGRSVLYTDRRESEPSLVIRATAGRPDDEQVIVGGKQMKLSGDWSADGRHFVFVTSDPDTRLDLSSLDTASSDKPRPFLQTPTNEMQPAISPDGRWLAYASDESGRWEVYVQAFPQSGAKRAISTAGGVEPRWTRGGRELVYLGLDGTLTAVEISSGAELEVGGTRPLFRAPLGGEVTRYRNHYVVTADGQRFLVDIADESSREPISVVVNWDALIQR